MVDLPHNIFRSSEANTHTLRRPSRIGKKLGESFHARQAIIVITKELQGVCTLPKKRRLCVTFGGVGTKQNPNRIGELIRVLLLQSVINTTRNI